MSVFYFRFTFHFESLPFLRTTALFIEKCPKRKKNCVKLAASYLGQSIARNLKFDLSSVVYDILMETKKLILNHMLAENKSTYYFEVY